MILPLIDEDHEKEIFCFGNIYQVLYKNFTNIERHEKRLLLMICLHHLVQKDLFMVANICECKFWCCWSCKQDSSFYQGTIFNIEQESKIFLLLPDIIY